MVYMSRMPVDCKEGQSRVGKRQGDVGPKRSAGADGGGSVGQELEVESASFGITIVVISELDCLGTYDMCQLIFLPVTYWGCVSFRFLGTWVVCISMARKWEG